MKLKIGFKETNLMIGDNVTKSCIKCGVEKQLTSFKTDKRGTRNVCTECRYLHLGVARRGKLKWLREGKQIPTSCQCCGKETDKLVFDHDHKTLEHRGWLCHPCNQGLGLLGDDIQSIRKALTYLETA
jgi:hypothetical protein